jgi:hypothetical protein
LFLNIPKLKEYAEERINWFKYGVDETPETKAKVSFYNNIFYNDLPKFAENYIDVLKALQIEAGADIVEDIATLVEKVRFGEFDLFEEKDD